MPRRRGGVDPRYVLLGAGQVGAGSVLEDIDSLGEPAIPEAPEAPVIDVPEMPSEPYRPRVRWVRVDNPLIGQDIVYQHPYAWPAWVEQFYFMFTTSGVAGNRQPVWSLRDLSNTRVAAVYPMQTQAATIDSHWQFNVGWPYHQTTAHSFGLGVPGFRPGWCPHVVIKQNWRLVTETILLDAGDQFYGIRLLLRECPL